MFKKGDLIKYLGGSYDLDILGCVTGETFKVEEIIHSLALPFLGIVTSTTYSICLINSNGGKNTHHDYFELVSHQQFQILSHTHVGIANGSSGGTGGNGASNPTANAGAGGISGFINAFSLNDGDLLEYIGGFSALEAVGHTPGQRFLVRVTPNGDRVIANNHGDLVHLQGYLSCFKLQKEELPYTYKVQWGYDGGSKPCCNHQFEKYQGFTESYKYCVHCDHKENL